MGDMDSCDFGKLYANRQKGSIHGMESNRRPVRKVYIDFLKIIAIYMVLFNHTNANGFILFTVARDSRFYLFYLFCAVFIKIAVPLFFMTSGALLLGKEESYKKLLTGRFSKYLVILVVSSFLIYLYSCLRINSEGVSIRHFFRLLYTSNASAACWYLYAYLAYILMLPLIRKLAVSMTKREYQWMFLAYGMMQMLSIADYILWKGDAIHNGHFSFFITSNYIFYPLMGYYMDQKMKEEEFTRKKAVILIAASIAAILVCCFLTDYRCTRINEWTEAGCQLFFNTLIFLPTITVYYITRMWFLKHDVNEKVCRLITVVGGTTFGIYLTELMCRIETKFVFYYLQPLIHTFPACLIWILTACLLGGTIVLLLKRIPWLGKFL